MQCFKKVLSMHTEEFKDLRENSVDPDERAHKEPSQTGSMLFTNCTIFISVALMVYMVMC